MSNTEAATRIVEIQAVLATEILGPAVTSNLFEEQRELWDEFFLGKPYELVFDLSTSH